MNQLGPKEIAQIQQAPVYFIATAPLSRDGTVNLSPKGLTDTIKVVDSSTVAYLDLTGSGAETAAHLMENGRITIMWCSFGATPNILRVYGSGSIHRPDSKRFGELIGFFGNHLGVRGIVEVKVKSAKNSCGFGVPVAESFAQRPDLDKWLQHKGSEALLEYQSRKNAVSLDGLDSWGAPMASND